MDGVKIVLIVFVVLMWAIIAWPVYLCLTNGFNKPMAAMERMLMGGGYFLIALGFTLLMSYAFYSETK